MDPHLALRDEQAVNRILVKDRPDPDGVQYVIQDEEWVELSAATLPSVEIECGTFAADACNIDCGSFT